MFWNRRPRSRPAGDSDTEELRREVEALRAELIAAHRTPPEIVWLREHAEEVLATLRASHQLLTDMAIAKSGADYARILEARYRTEHPEQHRADLAAKALIDEVDNEEFIAGVL